jgi:hydrogenase nickel incorporation protein HypA/HybF
MHELSIAYSMVELASAAAERAGASKVAALHLRLGALAGVVEEPLRLGFEIAAQGTPLAGARLEIEHLPVVIFCGTCVDERELDSPQRFRCPICGTPSGQVVQGRELEIVALELADPEEQSDGATAD